MCDAWCLRCLRGVCVLLCAVCCVLCVVCYVLHDLLHTYKQVIILVSMWCSFNWKVDHTCFVLMKMISSNGKASCRHSFYVVWNSLHSRPHRMNDR